MLTYQQLSGGGSCRQAQWCCPLLSRLLIVVVLVAMTARPAAVDAQVTLSQTLVMHTATYKPPVEAASSMSASASPSCPEANNVSLTTYERQQVFFNCWIDQFQSWRQALDTWKRDQACP
eukprot:scpid81310/ scgid9968/ 